MILTFNGEDKQPLVSLDSKLCIVEGKSLNVPLDCQVPPFILNSYDPLPPPALTTILPLEPSQQVGADDEDNEIVTAAGWVIAIEYVLSQSPLSFTYNVYVPGVKLE